MREFLRFALSGDELTFIDPVRQSAVNVTPNSLIPLSGAFPRSEILPVQQASLLEQENASHFQD